MDNKIKTFYHESFGKIRAVIISDEPWFIGKDVAEILGYSNTAKAIAVHVDEEDKQIFQTSQNGNSEINNRGMYIINESGLYAESCAEQNFSEWRTGKN